MNARQLEIFHAVMRCRTITAAADFLGISQPAVSKAIHAAEQRLGFRLLQPLKGRLYPTPEAEILLADADRIMRDLSAFQRLAAEVRSGRAGLVRIAASSSCATALLPRALAKFRETHHGVRVVSHLLPATGVAEMVATRQVDFGLTLSPVQAPGTKLRSLAAIEMVCLLPASHPLLERRFLRIPDLAPWPLISFGSDTHFGRVLDAAFEAAGAKRDIALEVTTSLVASCYVQRGLGLAIVDGLARQIGELPWRPLRPAVLLPVSLVTEETQGTSRLAAALIALLQETLDADRRSFTRNR